MPSTQPRRDVWWWAGLALVLAVGLLSHWSQLDLVEFKRDEAEGLNQAWLMLNTGVIPLAAPASSTGIINSPAITFLLAIPVALGWTPDIATGFLGSFTVAAAGLLYVVVSARFGSFPGLVAGLVLGSAFWLTISTRKVWDVGLVPFFATLCLWAAARWLVDGRRWSFVWLCLALAGLIQFHISSVPFLGVMAVWVALGLWWRRLAWAPALVGGGLFLLTFLPVILFQAVSGGASVDEVANLAASGRRLEPAAIQLAITALGDQGYQALYGPAGDQAALAMGFWNWAIGLLVVVGAVVAAVLAWRALGRRLPGAAGVEGATWRRGALGAIVLVAAVIPVAFYSLPTYPLQLHYFLQTAPPGAALLGVTAWAMRVRPPSLLARRAVTLAWSAGLVLYVGISLGLLATVLAAADSRDTEGGYSVPYRHWRDAVDRATAMVASPSETVLINTSLERQPMYRYLARGRFEPYFPELAASLVAPAGGARLVVLADSAVGPLGDELALLAPDHGRAYGGGVIFDWGRLDPGRMAAASPVARFANGVRVDSVSLLGGPRGAGPVLNGTENWVRVAWRAPDGGTTEHRFTARLRDATGRVVAQADGIGWLPPRWRDGDRIISWLPLALPRDGNQGPHTLELAMYVLGQPGRTPLLEGTPAADGGAYFGLVEVFPGQGERLAGVVRDHGAGFNNGMILLASQSQVLDDRLLVDLTWGAERRIEGEWTVFVHVVDGAGRVVAQSDAQPAGGAYPTTRWRVPDLVRDLHRVRLPADLPAGLHIVAGVYGADGQRALVVGNGDSVDLGPLRRP